MESRGMAGFRVDVLVEADGFEVTNAEDAGMSSHFLRNEARNKETYSLKARKRAKRTDVPSSARSQRKFAQRVCESGRRCAEVDAEGMIGTPTEAK